MNTRDLEAFLAVVDTGSIVAAAARLHLTQPGVTRRIQNLEQSLNATLLDRQSKPLKPTAAGRQAYELGRRVLASVDDLRSRLSPEGEIGGEFRLGLTPFLSEFALTEPLDQMRSAFPKLSLRITSGWSTDLLSQVETNRIDAAAVFLPQGVEPPRDFSSDPLGRFPVIVVAGRDLDIAESTNLRELSRFRWILNQDGCGFFRTMRRALEASRLPFDVAVETLSSDLRMSLVARGAGLGLTTEALLKASPFRDAVRIIDVADFKAEAVGWLTHRPPAGRLSAPLSLLWERISATLAAIG